MDHFPQGKGLKKSTNVSTTIMESKSKLGAAKKGDHPKSLPCFQNIDFEETEVLGQKNYHWVTFYAKRAHSPLGV